MIEKIKHRIIFNYKFAKTLGVGVLGRIRLFMFLSLIPVKRRLKKTNKLNVILYMKKFGKEFSFRISSPLDIAILYDVFVEDEYDFPLTVEPKVIVDLGSNVGGTLVYFALKYPDAQIFGYEPDPTTFVTLQSNVASYTNIYIEQAAITDKSGKIEFYSDPDSSMSSSLIKRKDTNYSVEVDAKTLDQIIQEQALTDISILKFDVEGAECGVFSDFKQSSNIKNIIGELHIDLINLNKEQFYALLPTYSFVEERLNLPSSPSAERYIIYGGNDVVH